MHVLIAIHSRSQVLAPGLSYSLLRSSTPGSTELHPKLPPTTLSPSISWALTGATSARHSLTRYRTGLHPRPPPAYCTPPSGLTTPHILKTRGFMFFAPAQDRICEVHAVIWPLRPAQRARFVIGPVPPTTTSRNGFRRLSIPPTLPIHHPPPSAPSTAIGECSFTRPPSIRARRARPRQLHAPDFDAVRFLQRFPYTIPLLRLHLSHTSLHRRV